MAYSDYNWIEDRLAIGALVSEPDDDFPFDAVISMETHAPATLRPLAHDGRIEYRWFSIIDGYSWESHDEIVRRFDEAAAQIHRWVEDGCKVLVHCTAGVSRSVSAVIWYLIRYHGFTWDDALALVRTYRPQAFPNIRFEVPLRLAAGERLDESRLTEGIEGFRQHIFETYGGEATVAEIRDDLERQGTLGRLQPAAEH